MVTSSSNIISNLTMEVAALAGWAIKQNPNKISESIKQCCADILNSTVPAHLVNPAHLHMDKKNSDNLVILYLLKLRLN